MFSYITLNDSRAVASAKLAIGGSCLDFSDIDFGRFSVEQRKVLVGVGIGGDCPRPSPSINSLAVSSQSLFFDVTTQASPYLIVSEDKVAITKLVIPNGSYRAEIDVFLDVPLQQLEGQNASKPIKDSFQYSQILTVIVSITARAEWHNHTENFIQKPVYEGYGQFGFMLANLTAMDGFLRKRYGDRDINLIDEFTTTELANDLFDQGLMVLVWGLTSWHYFIFALNSERERCSVPTKLLPDLKGCYKLSSRFNEFSVVRGTELNDWNQCKQKKWPTVRLSGIGESLNVEFHIKRFNPVGGSHGPAYPIIIMWRSDDSSGLSPILEVDIDDAE